MSERILIFGGTFDPPHRAHAGLPPMVAAALKCSRIIYVPASISPHKAGHPPTPPEHRLAMLKIAIRDIPKAQISKVELDRPGLSYTIDTLRELGRAYSGATFRLLMGSDQALQFHHWKDWQDILKLATPAILLRKPHHRHTLRNELLKLATPKEVDRWLTSTVDLPQYDISATQLRLMLARDKDAGGLIDPEVLAYIRANHLYEK